MKLIPQNITLENVKKSDYWNLIAILIWNHYSEKKYQDDSSIKIEEDWYGKCNSGGNYSIYWNDPNHFEEGYIRTLDSIKITFKRSDYITYIYIHCDGNINIFGLYSDKSKESSPYFQGSQRNLDITNWMIKNNFINISKENL